MVLSLLLSCLVSNITGAIAANIPCYYSNRDEARPYAPCDSTVNGVASFCCELTTSRRYVLYNTEPGYCIGVHGLHYRGGCTDLAWQFLSCPARCRDHMTKSSLYPSGYTLRYYRGSAHVYQHLLLWRRNIFTYMVLRLRNGRCWLLFRRLPLEPWTVLLFQRNGDDYRLDHVY